MRKLLLIFMLSNILIACGDEDSKNNSVDSLASPYVGQYFMALDNNENDSLISLINIKADSTFEASTIYFKSSNSDHAIVRLNSGTYSIEGDTYNLVYNYETCDPVGAESLTITSLNPKDHIAVKKDNTTLIFKNAAEYVDENPEIDMLSITEDVDCNLIPGL